LTSRDHIMCLTAPLLFHRVPFFQTETTHFRHFVALVGAAPRSHLWVKAQVTLWQGRWEGLRGMAMVGRTRRIQHDAGDWNVNTYCFSNVTI